MHLIFLVSLLMLQSTRKKVQPFLQMVDNLQTFFSHEYDPHTNRFILLTECTFVEKAIVSSFSDRLIL